MHIKKTVFFFLFLSILHYSKNTYSNICSKTFGKSNEKSQSSKQETPHNQDTLLFNKNLQDRLIRWVQNKSSNIYEFFKRHETITETSHGGTVQMALVEPQKVSSDKHDYINKKLRQYTDIKELFMNPQSPYKNLLELRNPFIKILIMQMSQYLAANGIPHIVARYTLTDERSINDFENLRILIQPRNDTPLTRLALSLYLNYDGHWIRYNPSIFTGEESNFYSWDLKSIYLHESLFLDQSFLQRPLREVSLLHELRHARIHNNLEDTPENPYHIFLRSNKTSLSRHTSYENLIHFSEMLTYQQDGRILLRQLTQTINYDQSNEALKTFILYMNIGLSLNENIETALSSALRSLNTQPNYDLKLETHSGHTWLRIPFEKEGFNFLIPFTENNNKNPEEMTRIRLDLALQVAKFHKNRYLVTLAVAEKAKDIGNTEERISLLKALQSAQILSQRFSPELKEESVRELENKIKEF